MHWSTVIRLIRLLAIGAAFFPMLLWAAPPCVSDTEYQVYAAVLFPQDSKGLMTSSTIGNVSQPQGVLIRRPELEGIWPGPYLVYLPTTAARIIETETPDHDAAKDFAAKNIEGYTIEKHGFLAAVPSAKQNEIAFISEEQRKADFAAGGWVAFRRKHVMEPCLTSFSRVRFNVDNTAAMVEVESVCDYEMGTGYRVLLKRSSGEHPWRVAEAQVNRTF